MKKLAIVCFALLFVVGNVFGQDQEVWKFSHLLFDFQKPQSNAWGIHGVAVDPDGKVWLSIHGNLHGEPVTNANGDTLGWYRPIYVLDPNTGEHALVLAPEGALKMPDGTPGSAGDRKRPQRQRQGHQLRYGRQHSGPTSRSTPCIASITRPERCSQPLHSG
ncbi:MAG: hypothetical protein Q9P14_06040 [candidate division KSB1 bacterium]|nr:hypothetical protein [candidate division KSB1 bacterium]